MEQTPEPTSILISIQYINELMVSTNENELKIFMHLAAIDVSESWKKESFYTGAEYLKKYMDKKFSALMTEVFRKTTMWFRSVDAILQLDNGRALLLRHGRENMVAYRGFAVNERELVLKMAKKNPIASFHNLLKSAGLRGKQNPENVKSIWKDKYLAEVKKSKKLQKKCDKQAKSITELKMTIQTMMGMHEHNKQKAA